MARHTIEFETNDNWQPLTPGCWVDCPASILVPLGEVCPAVKAYEKHGLEICPCKKFIKEE